MSSLYALFSWDWPSILNLFLLMALSCLFSFGGAAGQLIVVQNRLVDTGEITVQAFAFLVGVVYMLPGAKATFVSGVGYYIAGVPGAVAALLGLIVPTALLSGIANRALIRIQTVVDRAKPATGYVIAGIIGATALSTAQPLPIGIGGGLAILIIGYLIAYRDVEPLPLIAIALAIGIIRVFAGDSFASADSSLQTLGYVYPAR